MSLPLEGSAVRPHTLVKSKKEEHGVIMPHWMGIDSHVLKDISEVKLKLPATAIWHCTESRMRSTWTVLNHKAMSSTFPAPRENRDLLHWPNFCQGVQRFMSWRKQEWQITTSFGRKAGGNHSYNCPRTLSYMREIHRSIEVMQHIYSRHYIGMSTLNYLTTF